MSARHLHAVAAPAEPDHDDRIFEMAKQLLNGHEIAPCTSCRTHGVEPGTTDRCDDCHGHGYVDANTGAPLQPPVQDDSGRTVEFDPTNPTDFPF